MKARILTVLLVVMLPFASVRAAGFTEPPITFYGKLFQKADGYQLLLTSGQLAWTIQPTSGPSFVVTTPLISLGGTYSYQLLIPVEKVPNGFSISAATIPASSGSANYNRGSITLDGAPVIITSPALPGGATFNFAETQRGKSERVDLELGAAFQDSDSDGLPDWYETQYGFDPFDPNDGPGDKDGDGMTNAQEYLAGTNPSDPNDRLRIILVVKPGGLQVTWTSVPGRKYQVYSADPTIGPFTPLSGVITAGPGELTKNYTDATGLSRRFYKVVIVP